MFYVYILTNAHYTTLYTGSTADLGERLDQHATGSGGFAEKYNCDKLVWFGEYDSREAAQAEEARIKRWRRKWKDELISSVNPDWQNLTPS